jgi:signal transduction histidine kinase
MTRWCTIGVIAGFLIVATVGVATAQSKRVLMLHSFGPHFKPWKEYSETTRAELQRQSPWPLDIVDQSLVAARFPDEDPEVPFVEYLRTLYAKHPLDLIVSIGAPAAAFVQRHRGHLFTETPMVFTAVERRRVDYSALTDRDAVVAVSINYFAAFENIMRVLPDTKSVMIVVGTSPIEQFWMGEHRKEVKPFESRIAFTWTNHLSFEEILKQAASLPRHSAIFWELMFVDAAGVVHDGDKALTRLHAAANAPIFSYDDSFFGRAIVGGPIHSVLESGRRTAEVAVRILGGERAGDIKTAPVEFAPPKFDWREMQRWGISENRLPPGSVIHFREATIWGQYWKEILAIFAALLLQSAMIGWLLYEHRRRRQSEAAARRSEAAAHALSGRLITAQEEERSRLARELHDDVTQRLASLSIEAGRVEARLPGRAGDGPMHSMREGLARLSEDVHALSYRLHPSILTDLGLREALRSECEHFSQTSPVRVDFLADEIPEHVPEDVGLCLFRIVQESLRNIARHASATRAEIRMRPLDGGLQLTVKDNGVGFDQKQDRARASLGLASMRQRVALVGGKLNIDSKPLQGTTISAWVPVMEASAEPLARVAG